MATKEKYESFMRDDGWLPLLCGLVALVAMVALVSCGDRNNSNIASVDQLELHILDRMASGPQLHVADDQLFVIIPLPSDVLLVDGKMRQLEKEEFDLNAWLAETNIDLRTPKQRDADRAQHKVDFQQALQASRDATDKVMMQQWESMRKRVQELEQENQKLREQNDEPQQERDGQ